MKTTLIINLRRIGDIISSGHLISQLSTNEENVSILVFEEFRKAAEVLENIDHIYTIDRKKIETYLKSDLFHDALALDALYEAITPVSKKNWSQIINLSNDPLSGRLSSYLKEKSNTPVKGVSYGSNQYIQFSSEWAITYNDILTSEQINAPLHFQDAYHQIGLDRPYAISVATKLKISAQYENQTVESFAKIRENFGNSENSKIVGLQAKTSDVQKDIPFGTIFETIQMMRKQHPEWIPILLVAPNQREREFAERLNHKLKNKVITVEANLLALPSVIKSLDALITPDTAIKHYADVFNVPTLEVSLGNSPLFKQGTLGLNSAILTYRIDLRDTTLGRDRHLLEPLDIVESIDYVIKNQSLPQLSDNFTLYRPLLDDFGVRYVAVAGDISIEKEVFRVLSRDYLSRHLGRSQGLLDNFIGYKELYGQELLNYLTREKSGITEAMRSLLATLRALGKAKEPSSSKKSLIGHLDHLFHLSEQTNLSALPLKYFRAKMENLEPHQHNQKNLESLEQQLFNLKIDMQLLLSSINDFENYCSSKAIRERETIRKPPEKTL